MKYCRKHLLFNFFFILVLYTAAQVTAPDSLGKIVTGNYPAKEKIIAYKQIANIQFFKNFDDCLTAATSGYQVAVTLKDTASLGEFTGIIGRAHYFKGKYDSAATYYYKALQLLNTNQYVLQKAGVLNELGKLYRKTKDLDRALLNYDEAFAIYKKAGAENDMATILNESGVVFEYRQDYEEAASRYKKSLAIKTKLNDTIGMSYSYNFLGGVYTLQKKFSDAEKNLLLSLKLRQAVKDTFSIALSYADLGFMYVEQGNFDKALNQYALSNEIAASMKYTELLQTNYKILSDIAEKKGDTKLSLEYFKIHTSLKDSIYNSSKMKQIEELNAKYETEKKETQLKLQKAALSQKNLVIWGGAAGLLLLSLYSFSWYRKKQIQNKLQLQATIMEQQNLATKAVITAEENERKRIAGDLHDGVGQIMSAAKMNLSAFEDEITFKDGNQKNAFEKIILLVDESCKEVRNVSHQMMPNALLKSGLASAVREFIDKIDARVLKVNLHTEGLSERLDSNVETVLYRVIQECVNNVIKHSGANSLDISLLKDADGISATVEDNGKGFDIKDKHKFDGIGLKNILSRVHFLKGTVDFDSYPGKGTLVAIHVPLV